MRRFFLAFLVLVLPLTLPAQTPKAPAPKAPSSAAPTAPSSVRDSIDLPVRKVVLYKNGVGYFEHAGEVSGNQRVTVDFTSAQLNDVLQSLTALDSKGGMIGAVGYNSTMPIAQQLTTLALGLKDYPPRYPYTRPSAASASRSQAQVLRSRAVSLTSNFARRPTRTEPLQKTTTF